MSERANSEANRKVSDEGEDNLCVESASSLFFWRWKWKTHRSEVKISFMPAGKGGNSHSAKNLMSLYFFSSLRFARHWNYISFSIRVRRENCLPIFTTRWRLSRKKQMRSFKAIRADAISCAGIKSMTNWFTTQLSLDLTEVISTWSPPPTLTHKVNICFDFSLAIWYISITFSLARSIEAKSIRFDDGHHHHNLNHCNFRNSCLPCFLRARLAGGLLACRRIGCRVLTLQLWVYLWALIFRRS